MNFVPGEEKEGKMRIIHKEQVGFLVIIDIMLTNFHLVTFTIIVIVVRTESRHSAATECRITD